MKKEQINFSVLAGLDGRAKGNRLFDKLVPGSNLATLRDLGEDRYVFLMATFSKGKDVEEVGVGTCH